MTGSSARPALAPDGADATKALAIAAKEASRAVARATTAQKNAVLADLAVRLRGQAAPAILAANARDLEAAAGRTSPAMVDRLRLDAGRLSAVADAVDEIVALPDPVGAMVEQRRLANGLDVGRMRVPLGLVAIIYESRPNVTIDAGALCLKSGNATVLRGGSEAFGTNLALASVFADALVAGDLPPAAVTFLPTTDRAATETLIGLTGIVDLVIPRGGESLIRFVADHARVPVIQHYKGVCHVYVDGDADFEMAVAIAVNAKTHRPGVCNAMETLLVDAACAQTFLPRVLDAMAAAGVEIRADEQVRRLRPELPQASAEDFHREYLDLILSVAVVDGLDGAIAHIAEHGSHHTEAIVTKNYAAARRFVREVDASLVLVNASTRFNDGGQLGLGAEIGISTTKLHAYGPMGLAELCALKWVGLGDGQIRS